MSDRFRRPRRRWPQAGLSIDDIGAFEINEAFAVQVLAFLDHFDDRGRRPAGEPVRRRDRPRPPAGQLRGAADDPAGPRSSAEHPEVRYGITTMCIGLGMGGTVIWENPNYRELELGEEEEGDL